MAVFPIVYAGSIGYYKTLLRADQVVFEAYEHFPKQTMRSRMEILGPNGLQKLVIPTLKTGGRRTMNKVEISYAESWQKDHWKGLEAAYRRSPFFEYYEDQFRPFYQSKTKLLVDFNLGLHQVIMRTLQLEINHAFTKEYHLYHDQDYRQNPFNDTAHPAYIQVFSDRHPFVANLSILDALFNVGPKTKELLLQ